MTAPKLFVEGQEGVYNPYLFQGLGDNFKDDGANNLLPLADACVNLGTSLSATGADATSIAATEILPGEPDTAGIADTAINAGVAGIEWTGTGTDEQLTTQKEACRVSSGDNLAAGAWVYLEASAATDIQLRWVAYDSAGSVTETGTYATVNVTPNEWTYISTTIEALSNGSTVSASVSIEANGAQLSGDKLYVGALYLGPDASEWFFSITPSKPMLDVRFRVKILGDGVLFGTRQPCLTIEADSNELNAQVAWVNGVTLNTETLSSGANSIEYNKWEHLRFVHQDSGAYAFYREYGGQWQLIASGTGTSFVGASLYRNTAEGFDTTSLVAGDTNAYIQEITLRDNHNEWSLAGYAADWGAPSLLGVNLVLDHTYTLSVNQPLLLTRSGWVIDPATQGALKIPYRSEIKFGNSDFTVVQSFAGVANSPGQSTYYDTGISIEAAASGAVSANVSGTVTTAPSAFDGQHHIVLLEREFGVEQRLYLDDLSAAADSVADPSSNLNDTDPLLIGTSNEVDTTAHVSAAIGVTITFDRLLEDFEKDDLTDWINSGFFAEMEPDWLRETSVLYLNPADESQSVVYEQSQSVLNLGHVLPDNLYVRHVFTSDDGVANPTMSKNHLEVGQPQPGQTRGVAVRSTGTGQDPFLMFHGGANWSSYVSEEVESDWFNSDFAVAFWIHSRTTADDTIVGQGDGVAANTWVINKNASGNIYLKVANSTVLTATAALPDRPSLVVLTRQGNSFTFYVDGVAAGNTSSAVTVSPTALLEYGGGLEAMFGPIHLFGRSLDAAEVLGLYQSGLDVFAVSFLDSVTITDSISFRSLNWQKS